MRGQGQEKEKKKGFFVATVFDIEGTEKYHIIPGHLAGPAIAGILLLLVIEILLGALIILNKSSIDDLRDKIKVEESNTNKGK